MLAFSNPSLARARSGSDSSLAVLLGMSSYLSGGGDVSELDVAGATEEVPASVSETSVSHDRIASSLGGREVLMEIAL